MFTSSITPELETMYTPTSHNLAHPRAALQGSPSATYAHSAYSRRSSFSAVSSPAMSAHEGAEVPVSLTPTKSKSNSGSNKHRRGSNAVSNAGGHRDEWQRMRYFSRSAAASAATGEPSTPKTAVMACPPPPSFLRPASECSGVLPVAKSSPPKHVSPLAEWALGGRTSVASV